MFMARLKSLSATPAVLIKRKPADWVIEGPRKVSHKSVISSNHYATLHPLPVVKTNPVLIEANKEQFERETRL
jgi:NADH-quinone oxidoreductase subunit G